MRYKCQEKNYQKSTRNVKIYELKNPSSTEQRSIMQKEVTFNSDGLLLTGILHIPDNLTLGEKRPAFTVLHGFGSNKNGGTALVAAEVLENLGYIALRFDFRGCGESAGERGRVICEEQVIDTGHATTFLETLPQVQTGRVGTLGFSFGAAVACYAAGVNSNIAACISMGGWGDGEKKFKKQHNTPESWGKFSKMMQEGQEKLALGESIRVPRFDIVPIRQDIRNNLSPGSILEFPYEVVESMFNFRANLVVSQIAPRPLLLLHAANDTVTPTEQSIDLFTHAQQPTELHLFSNVDHFILANQNTVVHATLESWLKKYFPLHLI